MPDLRGYRLRKDGNLYELIARGIARGQQAIVLIPEIALTYQTVIRFYRRFGDRISIMNSRLH